MENQFPISDDMKEAFGNVKKSLDEHVEDALKEREDLGLSVPRNFSTYVAFHGGKGSMAQTVPQKPDPIVKINLSPFLYEAGEEKYNKNLDQVEEYFGVAQEFFNDPGEKIIFSFLENPKETISNFEEFFDKDSLEKRKDFFNSRGNSYESYKEFLVHNAPAVKQFIEEISPKFKSSLENSENFRNSVRHELDHVDLFQSNLFEKIYWRPLKNVSKWGNRFRSNEKKMNSLMYAMSKSAFLSSNSKSNPLMESRAMFFNHINPGEWEKAEYDEIKGKITDEYLNNYVDGNLQELMLDNIMPLYWSMGKMDRQTSNYLYLRVNHLAGSENMARYSPDLSKVNYKVANKILYEKFPMWKKEFANSLEKTAEFIGDAYKEDPSRLKRANNAKSFKDFLKYAKGKK